MSTDRIHTPHGCIHLHGATITSWKPFDRDVLFLSEHARFDAGIPIRGGVPLVFPWFGPDPEGRGRPAHGFARIRPWNLVEHDGDRVVFELVDDEVTHAMWPHRFRMTLSVVFGAELEMTLSVLNRDAQAFPFENAMHSYFAVGDVRQCALTGLQGTRYLDRNLAQREFVQAADPLRFAAATDHTYLGSEAPCVIDDPVYRRKISIFKQSSRSTIVWNPWSEWAKRTADFGDDEWQRMLCVESGNVGEDAITLAPDAEHRMRVVVRCVDA